MLSHICRDNLNKYGNDSNFRAIDTWFVCLTNKPILMMFRINL